MGKRLFVLLVLGIATPWAWAGHEAKGGNPLKNRVRQIGSFLVYHLKNNQVRLGARLKDLDHFAKVVSIVPLEIVESFPSEVTDELKESLTGATIDDDKSPVGKKILFHRERLTAALDSFDSDRSITIQFLRRSLPAKLEADRESDLLVESSFLGFCFHEFLLAAKEEDTHLGISQWLSATKKDMEAWMKAKGGMVDRVLTLSLPYLWGPVIKATSNDIVDREQALKEFVKMYESVGKNIEQQKTETIKVEIGAKLPLIQTTPSTKTPSVDELRFNSRMDDEDFRRAGTYYSVQNSLKVYLDTDTDITSEKLEKLKGEHAIYAEFPSHGLLVNLFYDVESKIGAFHKALSSYVKVLEEKLPEIRASFQSLLGDRFVYLDPGTVVCDFMPPQGGHVHYYLAGQRLRRAYYDMGYQFSSVPVLYRIQDE